MPYIAHKKLTQSLSHLPTLTTMLSTMASESQPLLEPSSEKPKSLWQNLRDKFFKLVQFARNWFEPGNNDPDLEAGGANAPSAPHDPPWPGRGRKQERKHSMTPNYPKGKWPDEGGRVWQNNLKDVIPVPKNHDEDGKM